MENSKRLTFDDAGAAASALRRLTRSPTGQRLGLRRSSTSSSSATSSVSSISSSSVDDGQTSLSCASRNASDDDDCALYRFIVWAAVKRNACHKMTEEQRRECPLLSCRKSFANHELMLRHLYTCEHLSGGEYWCYDCGRAERLNDSKCRRCLGHPSKRRKLMSMARKVFGSLGTRPRGSSSSSSSSSLTAVPSSLTVDEQPPSYDSLLAPIYAELPSNEIHEIDSTEISLPVIPECEPEPAPPEMFFMLQPEYPLVEHNAHSQQTKADPSPPDMEAEFINWEPSPSPTTVAPQNLLRPAVARATDSIKPALQLHTHGLEHYRPPVKRRSKTLAPSSSIRSTSSVESADSTSSSESYDISPMSGWSGGWTKDTGFASVLTSPCDDLVSPEDALPAAVDGGFTHPMKPPVEFTGPELGNLVANSFLSELPADVPGGIGAYARELILPDSMTLEPSDFSFEASVPLHLSVDPGIALGIDVPPRPVPPTPETTSSGSGPGNARSLVQAAEDTLRVHIAESTAKLRELDTNAIANKFRSLSPAAVALAGLETMTDILQGRSATSCTNLLCFIHLVYSFSLLVHERDMEARCGELFRQALLYSGLLPDHERPWYIEAVYSLWKPSQVSDVDVIDILRAAAGRSPFATPSSTYTSTMSNTIIVPVPGAGASGKGKGKAPEEHAPDGPGSSLGPGPDSLIFVAQYFLDELEYLALREVEHPDIRASALCTHHIKDLLHMDHDSPSPFSIAAKFLIERGFSAQFYGVPDFLPSVESIVQQVKSGRISTVRQLELELMQAGKLHLPVETFFDRYVEHVRQQVDLLYAVHGSAFSSRSTYHSCGIQLMRLFLCSPDASTNHIGPSGIVRDDGSFPGAVNGFIESMPKDLGLVDLMGFGPAASDPTASEWQPEPVSNMAVSLVDSGAEVDSLAAPVSGSVPSVRMSGPHGLAASGPALFQPPSPPPFLLDTDHQAVSDVERMTLLPQPPPPPLSSPLPSLPLPLQLPLELLPAPASAAPPTSSQAPAAAAAIKIESDSCCEICGYRPKGDPRWFGGSMAKHKKLQHSEETKIYRCPYPGCTSQYSKRPDNLRQHQIEKGHFVDGQGPARKRSRKREWSTEIG